MNEDILDAISKLESKLERKIAVLQQDVTYIRNLVSEVALVGPDVVANREHLLKLERQQGRFDLRFEEVERKIAGMSA
jgi:hypothetical protein